MNQIEFFVPGIPRPGGSKSFMGRSKNGKAILIDSSGANGKNWRASVAVFARQAYQGEPLTGSVALQVRFVMPRPKYHFDSKGQIKPRYQRASHLIKPDATKLIRAIEDALTGIVWRDDSQVTDQQASKRYGTKPGADVVIENWEDEP